MVETSRFELLAEANRQLFVQQRGYSPPVGIVSLKFEFYAFLLLTTLS